MNAFRCLASVGGIGFAPLAPGTAGSFAGLAIGAALLAVSPAALAAGALCLSAAGLWSVANSNVGDGDPSWVVIDEVAGQCVALLGLAAPTPFGLLAAFALFRLFDIAKPGPVGWADRRTGPVAIMADDLIAGIMAATVIALTRAFS